MKRATVTRVVGEQMAMGTKRAMATKTRLGDAGVAMTNLCVPHNNDPQP